MLKSESTKRCRKRIEGYSEIIEHVPGPDIRGDIFRTESKCINCKWLITSLIIIFFIVAGTSWYFIQGLNLPSSSSPYSPLRSPVSESTAHDGGTKSSTQSQSQSQPKNGTSISSNVFSTSSVHDRKKRNASNETDIDEINFNTNLHRSFDNAYEQFGKMRSAMENLFAQMKTYLQGTSSRRAYNSIDGLSSKQRRGASEHLSEVDATSTTTTTTTTETIVAESTTTGNTISSSVSFIQNHSSTATDVENKTMNEIGPSEANVITERTSTAPDQVNVSVAGVDIDCVELSHSRTIPPETDAPMLNTGTSPASEPPSPVIHSEPENRPKNDSSSNRELITSSNTDGDSVRGDSLEKYQKNTPPITEEIQQIRTTDISLVQDNDQVEQTDENTTSQRTQTQQQMQTSTTQFKYESIQQSESEFDVNYTTMQDVKISTTEETYKSAKIDPSTSKSISTMKKESNIMKIPLKTNEGTEIEQIELYPPTNGDDYAESLVDVTVIDDLSTEPSTIISDNEIAAAILEIQQRFDVVYNETLQIIKNSTSRMYLSQNLDENSDMDKILLEMIERFKRNENKIRHSRDADQSEEVIGWNLFCYQKIIKSNGTFDVKLVKIPLNQSQLDIIAQNLPSQFDLPAYSAHSLDVHKNFKKYSVHNETSANITDQINMYTLSSAEDAQGSKYYCSYSQARDVANDTILRSRIKMLWNNVNINLNEIQVEECSVNESMCADGSRCISTELWCDEIIHCTDFSDELDCTCGQRINKDKLCDGYFDCPNGEDEQACFECPKNAFSCDDWLTYKQETKVTCLPMEKRCDDVVDCPNGKDEKDCELLVDNIFSSNDKFLVSYTSGYLQRNWKGKWYPVCEDKNSIFSIKACESELGIQNIRNININPRKLPNHYDGEFITTEDFKIDLVDKCTLPDIGIFVECPVTEYCGTRVKSYDTYKYQYKREITGSSSDTLTEAVIRTLMKNYNSSVTSHVRKSRSEEGRVVGGKVSEPGFWPWIVALYKDGVFHCGAVILDENWIVTAAHCVEGYRNRYFEIQAGILRRLSFSPTIQIRRITHVILHERYSRQDMRNDIALLHVDHPLKMNRWIRPVCLPETRPPWGPTPGEKCTAIGWGATHERGPDPDNMHEVELPILPSCKHLPDIQGHEICAGFVQGKHDTCQGDSGGPLLCRIPSSQDHWYLAGIVSHGEGCARPKEPGVYTRIALYIDWIMENTNNVRLERYQQTIFQCPGMRCTVDGRCIPRKQICDNVIDCLNGEDEIDARCLHIRNSRASSAEKMHSGNTTSAAIRSLTDIKQLANNSQNFEKFPKFDVFKQWSLKDHNLNRNETYVCKIIEQDIAKEWYCDGEVDCEDGTDEINCTCSDHLKRMNSSLICNGIVDCSDLSDEKNCTRKNCTNTKDDFLCYQSYTCINRTKLCDGKSDCLYGEDEKHCYALSDDLNITTDSFNASTFVKDGTIMEYKNGTWKPYCLRDKLQHEISVQVCKYLGFRRYISSEVLKIATYPSCKSIEISCSDHMDEAVTLPWYGNIYINGLKKCTGLLFTAQWLIADYNCPNYDLQEDHMVIVLGGNRIMENVIQSPYEQIIRIDYSYFDSKQEVTMMHLENPAITTKYVRPFNLAGRHNWLYPPSKDTQCFMIVDQKSPIVIPIISQEECLISSCPYRPMNKTLFCSMYTQNYTLSSLICLSLGNYWYLTAPTNKQFDEFCSTNSFTFLMHSLENPDIKEDTDFKQFASPKCSTFRCSLGTCLGWSEICDGKPDCRNKEDETPEVCAEKLTFCRLEQYTCPCKTYEFRCKNSQCIDRNFICNGNDDCGDGSDESAECFSFSCATYLNMTNPSKLCNNRVDCSDKSDETPHNCPSICKTSSNFKCEKSGQCIPSEFVCDGEKDCSEGEDERKCWKLDNNQKNLNEPNIFVQKYGKWQKQCLSPDFTSFRPDVVCKESHFSKQKLVKFIPGTSIPSAEYTSIFLRNNKEFKLKAKPLIGTNQTDACFHVHLKCE